MCRYKRGVFAYTQLHMHAHTSTRIAVDSCTLTLACDSCLSLAGCSYDAYSTGSSCCCCCVQCAAAAALRLTTIAHLLTCLCCCCCCAATLNCIGNKPQYAKASNLMDERAHTEGRDISLAKRIEWLLAAVQDAE